MTTETRFQDIINGIVTGPFYDPQGIIIPFNAPAVTTLRLETAILNTTFLILVNDVQRGFVVTDGNGAAVFDVLLPKGDIDIILQREFSTDFVRAIITTRDTAVWHAAVADQIENIDDSVEATLDSFYLAKAKATDINLVHGVLLNNPNESNASLEAYRETLQLVRQSFRQFGGRTAGKFGIVAAITQVNPLIFDRSKAGPRWVLGFDDLPGGDLQTSSRIATSAFANINGVGTFVTIISIDSYVNAGAATLSYNSLFDRFIWTPPSDTALGLDAPLLSVSPRPSTDERITIPSGRARAFLDSLHFLLATTAGEHDHIFIALDGIGTIVDINLTLGQSLTIDVIINSFFRANEFYNKKRIITTQPVGGSIASFVRIISVSDNTAIGSANIQSDPVLQEIAYNSQGDSIGVFKAVTPGEPITLVSGNGIDTAVVLVSVTILPLSSTTTFIVGRRYDTPASLIAASDQLRLTSQNVLVSDGPSEVIVHDGPGNAASFPISGSLRGHFDIPKTATTLSTDIVTNDNSIEVPANSAGPFSQANGLINTPFDIIAGYGFRTGSITSYTLTPDDNSKTAVLDISASAATFLAGDTHVNLNFLTALESINTGVHKILTILTSTTACISYSGVGASQPVSATGISVIGIDHKTTFGTGTLSFVTVGQILGWNDPAGGGSIFIPIGAGGYFRIFTGSGLFIDVLVDAGSLPGGNTSESLQAGHFLASTQAGGSNTVRVWSMGEMMRVTDVTTGATDIWDVEDPIVGNYVVGQTVYLDNDRLPLLAEGEDSFGDLTVDIDFSEQPTAGSIFTDTVTINGSDLPDGWLDTSTGGTPVFLLHPEAKYEKGALLIDDAVSDVIIEHDIPFSADQCGFLFTFKAWVRNISITDAFSMDFRLGFDFGFGFVDGSIITISDPDNTIRHPALLEFAQVLPPNATQFTVRIRRLTATADDFIVERAAIVQTNFNALFLGHNTIPRSPDRASTGSLFYVWSPDELTTEETNLLGVAVPAAGQIQNIHNAHEDVDAFDVTDILTGVVTNVRGAIDEAEWLTATLINMEIVGRIPTRFSFARPTRINLVSAEILTVAGGPNTAPLAVTSDQDQTSAILFEDDVPVPNDEWTFNTATEIEILSGFNSSAVYTIDYQALIQLETAVIDITIPTNNGIDTWFADFVAWNRHRSDINTIRGTVSAIFNAAFNATLPRRSDQSKLNSVLIEDTGIIQRTIPQSQWNYIDSLTVNINSSQFNPEAIYSFTYNQRITDPDRQVTILAEVRSAVSAFSLSTAIYLPFGQTLSDNCIDSGLRFHQIRLTLSNVIDLRDVRIHSALVKGLNLIGAGSPPPGL